VFASSTVHCGFEPYFNCNTSCDGCLSDDCDTEYGVCTDTSGCKPGWQYGHSKCDKGILNIYCTFYNISEFEPLCFSHSVNSPVPLSILFTEYARRRRGRDRMVIGNYLCIQYLSPLML
jgi:hypothetical protein